MNLLMWNSNWDGSIPLPAVLKPVPLWTGKQLLSLIIPKINLTRYHSSHDEKAPTPDISPFDTVVQIQGGQLISGMVCKRTVGSSAVRAQHPAPHQRMHGALTSFAFPSPSLT